MPFDRELGMYRCATCRKPVEKVRAKAYCRECHNAYMREYMKRYAKVDVSHETSDS